MNDAPQIDQDEVRAFSDAINRYQAGMPGTDGTPVRVLMTLADGGVPLSQLIERMQQKYGVGTIDLFRALVVLSDAGYLVATPEPPDVGVALTPGGVAVASSSLLTPA